MIAEGHLKDKAGLRVGLRRPNALRWVLGMLWCFSLFGLLQPTVVTQAAGNALALCAGKLIPSLFPLAASGSILAQLGSKTNKKAGIGRLWSLMGLSPASSVCVLLGLFAGFPVGAIIASSLAESGKIDSEEASRLCCFTGNASAAFLVGAVGSGLFCDSRIGWLLWLAQSLSALTVGIIMGRSAMKAGGRIAQGADASATASEDEAESLNWGAVSRAIASSAQGMLTLAAFVVFFSAFSAFVQAGMNKLLVYFSSSDITVLIETAVDGFLEISGGLRSVSALELPMFAKVMLASAITGWSGLSVYMQVLAAAKGLSKTQTAALPRRLAKAKAASAALTVVYAGGLYGVYSLSQLR